MINFQNFLFIVMRKWQKSSDTNVALDHTNELISLAWNLGSLSEILQSVTAVSTSSLIT
jgi:hypothetical protein